MEEWRHTPTICLDHGLGTGRQDAGDIALKTATRNMRHALNEASPIRQIITQLLNLVEIAAMRPQECISQRLTQLWKDRLQRIGRKDSAGQRVAIGVQP